jgi:hypothetical protein
MADALRAAAAKPIISSGSGFDESSYSVSFALMGGKGMLFRASLNGSHRCA